MTRFGDMTWPMIMAILTDGKAGEAADKEAKMKRVMHDFRSGKLAW